MLDIKFIRENSEKVKKAAENKGVKVDIEKLLELDKKKSDLLQKVETLRTQKNQAAKDKDVIKGKKVKKMLQDLEPQLTEVSEALLEIMYHIPNPAADDVKVGKSDKENEIIKTVGEQPKFDFKILDHVELGKKLDLIDSERAGKISGSRFTYLKNQAVLLEFALVQFLMDRLTKKGFTPIIPPVIEKMSTAKGTGYFEALNDDAYHTKQDEMVLVGTSEQSVVPYYMDEIIKGNLPKKFVAFSTCFRREAGSYGKDVTGILRQHQFDKVEMVIFSHPEKSEKTHQEILKIEEEVISDLGLAYQISKMVTGDLGMPAVKKFDIEAWIPSQKKYRELTSCSNCTDFQARRLNIKFKDKDGKNKYVHILNGTGLAMGRTIVAILENYQQKDGSIKIPKVLHKYCGFQEIKKD